MGTIVLTILPVFGLILFGVFLRKIRFLDVAMEQAVNRLAYWVCLPMFILLSMANAPRIDLEALRAAAALILVTLGMVVMGVLLFLLLRLPKPSRGAFLQAGFRGNLAYVGIPVIVFSLRETLPEVQLRAESLAVITMTPVVLLYNILGVMALEWDRRHLTESHPLKTFVRSTLRNPLVIACILGLAWNLAALPVPNLLYKMAKPVADAAFPLALLAIGARIASLPRHGAVRALTGVCLVKNILALPMAWGICALLGLEDHPRLVVLVLAATPTAVASYVLVDQLDGDRDLGASTIAATTAVSVLSLSVALWLAGLKI